MRATYSKPIRNEPLAAAAQQSLSTHECDAVHSSTAQGYSREFVDVYQVDRHGLSEPGLLVSGTHAHGAGRRACGRDCIPQRGRRHHEGGGPPHEERYCACDIFRCHDSLSQPSKLVTRQARASIPLPRNSMKTFFFRGQGLNVPYI